MQRSESRKVEPIGTLYGRLCLFSPDCVKILDPDGRLRFFNEEGLRAMAIADFFEVEGRYWPDLWPEESRTMVEDALAGARDRGVTTFVAMCPTANGAQKWWNVTVAAIPAPSGHFAVISRDVTAERQAESRGAVAFDRLNSIMRSTPDVLWDIDLKDGSVWWGEGMESTFGYGPDEVGPTTEWCHDHIHPDDRERVAASMTKSVEDGSVVWESDFRYRCKGGNYVEVYDRGSIHRDTDGNALRFLGVMQDVSARNALLETQKLIAGEMAHRINNTLAVVAGLFQQSARASEDIESLVDSFGGRLVAMAMAHTAVLRQSGKGASLADLAERQLAPFVGAGKLSIEGEEITLPETVVHPVALALNELATNAIKYGALSSVNGKVALSWGRTCSTSGDKIVINWRERGGPKVKKPTHVGLGSRLIEHGIRNAEVSRTFDPDGFSCSISIPI